MTVEEYRSSSLGGTTFRLGAVRGQQSSVAECDPSRTVVSNSQIAAHGGTVDVTVETPAGASATSWADQFTYR